MADNELISRVLQLLKDGDFSITQHARQRMRERGVSAEDITWAAYCSPTVTTQEYGKLRIDGEDKDGDELTIIAVYQDGVLIITVF